MTRSRLSALIALVLIGATPGWAADYQVIVHATNPIDIMTREQVGKVFLKRVVKWDTGMPIVPVDQTPVALVRAVFTKAVHGKPVSALSSYWQQQIFAGRDVPPSEKADDAAVLAFVRANPGAIGYVGAGAAADGVKVLVVR